LSENKDSRFKITWRWE